MLCFLFYYHMNNVAKYQNITQIDKHFNEKVDRRVADVNILVLIMAEIETKDDMITFFKKNIRR